MRRRELGRLSGAATVALATPAFAQKDLPIVAVINFVSVARARERLTEIGKGLKNSGFVEGVNYSFAMRTGDGDAERMPGLIRELAALRPAVIISVGVAPAILQHAPELPHVFTAIASDPVALGLAASYARPGGNATGNVLHALGGEDALISKRIGLFRELVPNFNRLGFIGTARVLPVQEVAALRRVGGHFGFELVHHAMTTIDDLDRALAATLDNGADAMCVSGEPITFANLPRIASVVTASRKPSVGPYPDWVRAGFLMSYGTDPLHGLRRAGEYAAKILSGAKPRELPIEQATKFYLAVNNQTARQLGVQVPPTFLADEIID